MISQILLALQIAPLGDHDRQVAALDRVVDQLGVGRDGVTVPRAREPDGHRQRPAEQQRPQQQSAEQESADSGPPSRTPPRGRIAAQGIDGSDRFRQPSGLSDGAHGLPSLWNVARLVPERPESDLGAEAVLEGLSQPRSWKYFGGGSLRDSNEVGWAPAAGRG